MTMNRRAQRNATAVFANAENTFARAAALLISGEPLSAMRLTRVTEQLLSLHTRISRLREHEAKRRHDDANRTLEAARLELVDREGAVAVREWRLSQEAERIEALRRDVEALYAKLYTASSADAGSPEFPPAPGDSA